MSLPLKIVHGYPPPSVIPVYVVVGSIRGKYHLSIEKERTLCGKDSLDWLKMDVEHWNEFPYERCRTCVKNFEKRKNKK